MAHPMVPPITVTARERVGRNVRLTVSTGYVLKTAGERAERIACTQKLRRVD